jgi:hypothetical protein
MSYCGIYRTMPFKDKEKTREYGKEWAKKNYRKNRRRCIDTVIRYHKRMLADPIKHEKWKAQRRKHCKKIKDKIKVFNDYQTNKRRFGGNRYIVLKRDSYRCRVCSKGGRLDIHHIDGNGRGKKNPNCSVDNLISLCHFCHKAIHFWNKIRSNSLANELVSKLT